MNNKLLCEFEELLDNEAKRVVGIVQKMYKEGVEVNKSYESLVRSLIDKRFEYFSCDIQLRSYSYIPSNLEPDQNCVKPLVTRIEATENHLQRYINWCKNDIKDKDHYDAAERMAKKLIKYGNFHKKTNKTMPELIAKYMPNFFPTHHDSVDSRAVVLLLQNEISTNGYMVSSVNPFRIVKL